jgi:hypothetical protein
MVAFIGFHQKCWFLFQEGLAAVAIVKEIINQNNQTSMFRSRQND